MRLNKENVDLARARNFLTLQQLGKLSGVSTVTIRKGFTQNIDPLSIAKVAKTLNVDITEILAGDEHA